MLEGQQTLYDLDTWFGKTSPEPFPAKKARIFGPSLKKPPESRMVTPLYLDLRKGNGLIAEPLWEMDGLSLGDYTTRSFGEYPSAAVESRLWQILEAIVHPKYYLSAKACEGIARRAERRGKKLPRMLAEALCRQIAHHGEIIRVAKEAWESRKAA